MAAAAAAAASAVTPPSRLELMLLDTEFRDIYRSASLRADGSSTRGRKSKHDTATRRWIDTIGFPLLAMGKLPEAHDLAMLRSGPRNGLRGQTLAARDACLSGVQTAVSATALALVAGSSRERPCPASRRRAR